MHQNKVHVLGKLEVLQLTLLTNPRSKTTTTITATTMAAATTTTTTTTTTITTIRACLGL